MEIILLQQVKKLGNIGEVVNVKNGYARNFLLPNKQALRATKANIDFFETRKVEINKQNQEQIKIAKTAATKVDGILVTVLQQAGEDGRLYGSVTITDIAAAVSTKSKQEVARKLVVLHDPIKYIGIHSVEIDLHADVTVTVNVNVARTADEAKSSAYKFSKGQSVMEGPGATYVEQEEEVTEEVTEATVAEEVTEIEATTEEAA